MTRITKKAIKRSSLVKQLDTVFSQYIRLRDGRCVTCSKPEPLDCSHFFGRRAHGGYAVRWDERNCNAQCKGCNIYHNSNPEPYRRYMIKKYGEDTLHELEKQINSSYKYTNPQLESLIETYKRKVRDLQKS